MNLSLDSWEKLQNDVEVIKNRVKSLDRIQFLQNKQIIIDDIKLVVANNLTRAVILKLAKKRISRAELIAALQTDNSNVNK